MSKYYKAEDVIRVIDDAFDSISMEQTTEMLKARRTIRNLPSIEVSEDCISREGVYRAIITCGEVDNDLNHLYKVIENEPSVIPSCQKNRQVERAEGEWIDKGDYAECSNCGAKSGTQYDGVEPVPLKTQFCPNCGAKMKGASDE